MADVVVRIDPPAPPSPTDSEGDDTIDATATQPKPTLAERDWESVVARAALSIVRAELKSDAPLPVAGSAVTGAAVLNSLLTVRCVAW